jgi:hypothetical protein
VLDAKDAHACYLQIFFFLKKKKKKKNGAHEVYNCEIKKLKEELLYLVAYRRWPHMMNNLPF